MEREITKYEERAYRLCHHEHEGWPVKDAAYLMDCSDSKIRRLLKSLKQKAPQLFPILTKQQYAVYQLYVEHGRTQQAIAIALNTTRLNIQHIIQRMKDKGIVGLDASGIGDTVRYEPSMDKHIKRKF